MAWTDAENFFSSLARRNMPGPPETASVPQVQPRLRQRFEASPANGIDGRDSSTEINTGGPSFSTPEWELTAPEEGMDDSPGTLTRYPASRVNPGEYATEIPGTRYPPVPEAEVQVWLHPGTEPHASPPEGSSEIIFAQDARKQASAVDSREAEPGEERLPGLPEKPEANLLPGQPEPLIVQPQIVRVMEPRRRGEEIDEKQSIHSHPGNPPATGPLSPAPGDVSPASHIPQPVQVTIGRVEVRLSMPPVAPHPPAVIATAREAQGLDEYLRRGARGKGPGSR
jgi:hypothetical protein